jgi:glycosyltransferase involved in cell wall biosynthesis
MVPADDKPIVSLCLAAFAGADRAAANLSLTTGLLRHLSLASSDPRGREVEFAIAYLRERRPALVIFNGWSAVYARVLASLRRQATAFAVLWQSGAAQTDLAGEWPALGAVVGERRIAHLFIASESLYATLATRVGNARYLPNTLAGAEWDSPDRHPRGGGGAEITLFAQPAESARKNVTGCLLALGALRRRHCLHLNGLSRERRYRMLLDLLRIRYRDWGWMSPQRYDAVVRRASIGLQVSLAETYGYVVAEHLARGVPVVGSAAVPVLARLSPAVRRRLIVTNPDDPAEIGAKIRFLLDHPRVAAAIGARAQAESLSWNRRDIAKARATLTQCLAHRSGRAP